jgi:hypothetical protein
VKADGLYCPCFPYFPSLAAWRSLAVSAAVVVFELPFGRSAAVFAVAVVSAFAAGVARSLVVARSFAAAVAAAAAAQLADRPQVALPTDGRSTGGWLDDSHLDWPHSEYWQPVGDSGLLSPQADSVFLQADSDSASLRADLGLADLALVDLD